MCGTAKEPVIISTGMASREEIGEAVAAAQHWRCERSDSSTLPCRDSQLDQQANLRTSPRFGRLSFGVIHGFLITRRPLRVLSPPLRLVMRCREHFTLRRADGRPDSAFSLGTERILAFGQKITGRVYGCGWGSVAVSARRFEARKPGISAALYVVSDVAAGEELTPNNVRSIRPGYGLQPGSYRSTFSAAKRRGR